MIAQWVDRCRSRYESVTATVLRRPVAARGYAAFRRYYARGMHHHAGSVIYFGVLTVFPLVVLLLLGALRVVSAHPEMLNPEDRTLGEVTGVSGAGLQLMSVGVRDSTRAVMATLGVTGLLYAGRKWVEAYRRAFAAAWRPRRRVENVVITAMRDFTALLVILVSTTVLVGGALMATDAPYRLAAIDGHGLHVWAVWSARATAFVLTALWGALVSSALFHRLGNAPRTADTRHASLAAGLCLAGLAVVGLVLLRKAFADPVYGLIIMILGLMLWVSAATRITLALAVWAGTPRPRTDDRLTFAPAFQAGPPEREER